MITAKLLHDFFTNAVAVPSAPAGLPARALYWEERDGWKYPWRIVSYEGDIAQGYPCGEPSRVST